MSVGHTPTIWSLIRAHQSVCIVKFVKEIGDGLLERAPSQRVYHLGTFRIKVQYKSASY